MCNVHLVYKLAKTLNKDDINVMCKLLNRSCDTNQDGFGVFDNNSIIYKTNEKYSKDHKDKIMTFFNNSRSKFVVGHNRLATSGKVKVENSHPFYNDSFIWVHNGIIQNFEEIKTKFGIKANVDSDLIGELIHMKLLVYPDIIEAIKQTTKELKGSFSVFLFDKINQRLFYFKNDGTDFNMQLIKHKKDYYIVGTTKEDNLFWFFTKTRFGFVVDDYTLLSNFSISDNTLYEINDKGVIRLDKIEFSEIVYNVVGYGKTEFKDYTRIELESGFNEYFNVDIIKVNKTKKGHYKIEFTKEDERLKKQIIGEFGFHFKDKKQLIINKDDAEIILESFFDGYNTSARIGNYLNCGYDDLYTSR